MISNDYIVYVISEIFIFCTKIGIILKMKTLNILILMMLQFFFSNNLFYSLIFILFLSDLRRIEYLYLFKIYFQIFSLRIYYYFIIMYMFLFILFFLFFFEYFADLDNVWGNLFDIRTSYSSSSIEVRGRNIMQGKGIQSKGKSEVNNIILYCTILYYTIVCYTILYYTVLYYTILYCTVL